MFAYFIKASPFTFYYLETWMSNQNLGKVLKKGTKIIIYSDSFNYRKLSFGIYIGRAESMNLQQQLTLTHCTTQGAV